MRRRKLTPREEEILEGVYEAWTKPGINPQYHARRQDVVRAQMPTLAHHLDALEKARNTGRRS